MLRPTRSVLQHVVEQALHAEDPFLHQLQILAHGFRNLGPMILEDPGGHLADRPQRRPQVVRSGICEFIQLMIAAFQLAGVSPNLLLGGLAMADISNESTKLAAAAYHERRNLQLDRELVARFPQGVELDPPVQERAAASGTIVFQAAPVCDAIRLRNDQFGERVSHRFVSAPAEDGLGLRVPARDDPLVIDRDDRIEGRIQDQPHPIRVFLDQFLVLATPQLGCHLSQIDEDLDFRAEDRRHDGRFDEVDRPLGVCLSLIDVAGVGCQKDDRRASGFRVSTNQLGCLEAPHARHMHVEQHDGEILVLEFLESFLTGIRGHELDIEVFQDHSVGVKVRRTVVRDQDARFFRDSIARGMIPTLCWIGFPVRPNWSKGGGIRDA